MAGKIIPVISSNLPFSFTPIPPDRKCNTDKNAVCIPPQIFQFMEIHEEKQQ